ncbi:MAG: hypothetical protein EBT80_07105, partial [Chitinophagales bacterium]|nr:hypothetical protein [Chitinophagales bacterium]
MIGVIGAGLVGSHTVDALIARGQVQLMVNDTNLAAARRLALRSGSGACKVQVVSTSEMFATNVVVLACPAPHAKAARRLLEAGVSV